MDGDAAAHKFMTAIPVKQYCDTIAYRSSQHAAQPPAIQQGIVTKVPSETSEGKHSQSGIYDGPLSPAARLRAAASSGIDDVAVGMGDEEELCSICLGEFEAHDKVKELK